MSKHRPAFREKERTNLDKDEFSQPHEPKPKKIQNEEIKKSQMEENKIGENANIKPPTR